MPGLFGSGSQDQKQPDNSLPNYTPPWLANLQQVPMTNAPGQIAGLARDMAAGGFGNQKANTAWLNQNFPATTMMAQKPPAPVTPVTPTPVTPTAPTVNKYKWQDGKLVAQGRNAR